MVPTELAVKNERNTLSLPIWFLILAIFAIGIRAYWKISQFTACDGSGVSWLTPTEFNKQKDILTKKGKNLILYEFTAKWCPPCQARERTSFKNPDIIKKINSTFIPVRIDLTQTTASDNPENKELIESFSVYSIPRCVVTLNTGEKVDDDRYMYSKEFDEFLDDTIKQSNVVRSEVLLADGKEQESWESIKNGVKDIEKNLNYLTAPKFLLYHHLLCRLGKTKEAAALVESAASNNEQKKKQLGSNFSENILLSGLTDYMQGKIDEKELLSKKADYYERCSFKLEIGLAALRKNDKVKARKELQDAALENARMWRGDKLAEYLLKKLDN